LLQNLQDSGGGHAEKSFLERSFGAKSRKLFGNADVKPLVQGYTFGFCYPARLRQQRRLQAQRIAGQSIGSAPAAGFSVRTHAHLLRPGAWNFKNCLIPSMKIVRTISFRKNGSRCRAPESSRIWKGRFFDFLPGKINPSVPRKPEEIWRPQFHTDSRIRPSAMLPSPCRRTRLTVSVHCERDGETSTKSSSLGGRDFSPDDNRYLIWGFNP